MPVYWHGAPKGRTMRAVYMLTSQLASLSKADPHARCVHSTPIAALPYLKASQQRVLEPLLSL